MGTQTKEMLKASREQIIYANLLIIGVWVGIAVLVATYAIYLSGILSPHVDLAVLPTLWGKGVAEFLEVTHAPHGWGWLSLLDKGDYLNYIGFVLLAVMTIICYMVLVRGYLRQKDWIYSAIAILEILVLGIAASGLLGSGGH